MRNVIALTSVVLLGAGVWYIRQSYPKAGGLESEGYSASMEPVAQASPPAPPPPAVSPKPVTIEPGPQPVPVTEVVRETDTITNLTEVQKETGRTSLEDSVFFHLRIGYDRTQFGPGGSTWFVGAQFNVRPQAWYGDSPDIWARYLVPDATAEIGHGGMTATARNGTPLSGDGVRVDLDLYWPWLNWSVFNTAPDGNRAPFLDKFSIGPVVYGALQEVTSLENAQPDWVRYGGIRFMYRHLAYVDYMVGKTDSLPGVRQQVTADFPIYQKPGSDLRYVVHALWNSSLSSHQPDDFGIALQVEIPLDALVNPRRLRDLLPFLK